MYFKESGEKNTEKTLEIAKEEALKRGIRYVVVASTRGNTGKLAAELFRDTGIKLIVVTHNTGFKEHGVQELTDEAKKEIESIGGIVHTGTMVLRGIGSSLRKNLGYSEEQIVADTLRIICQGMKVCVEMAAMTCDAGLVPPGDIITIAGTGRGADTACIVKASPSNRFFNIKVREILCKPIDW